MSILTAIFSTNNAQVNSLEIENSDKRLGLQVNSQTAQMRLLVDYFFAAARTGDIEVLNHFIEAGFPIDQRNNQSYSALMVAAYNGQAQAASVLLEHGANACLQDKRGNTAMMGAVIKAEFAIVKQLYSQECDAELTNNSGMTLQEFAQYWGQSSKLKEASLAAKQSLLSSAVL
nr:ankyrin repeat domain-containing protein [Shewanella pealeana]